MTIYIFQYLLFQEFCMNLFFFSLLQLKGLFRSIFVLFLQSYFFLWLLIGISFRRWRQVQYITKTSLFKYIENFTTKKWKFSDKNSDIFHISAQKHRLWGLVRTASACQGISNEYPQFMVLSRNKKNNVYPCKPQFYYIKVGFKGVNIIQVCFLWWYLQHITIFTMDIWSIFTRCVCHKVHFLTWWLVFSVWAIASERLDAKHRPISACGGLCSLMKVCAYWQQNIQPL